MKGQPMTRLTKSFNTATVRKGETFTVELEANPTTGYLWDMRLKAGKATLVSQKYTPAAPAGSLVIGGGGVETFVFRAEETGQIELEAEYSRPWEKNAKPAAVQRFDIRVR
jgi:inhibitor of cysteine peptidase